jgi:hypothetical protein
MGEDKLTNFSRERGDITTGPADIKIIRRQ